MGVTESKSFCLHHKETMKIDVEYLAEGIVR